MRVSFKDSVLTVVTEVTKEVVEKGYTDLTAKDDKGNPVYKVTFNNYGDGSIDKYGFTGNTYVGGKLAYTVVTNADTTLEDVQKVFGEALLAADTYISEIAADAEIKRESIEALFADAE